MLEAPSLTGSITNRSSHAFVFKLSGRTIYKFGQETTFLEQGEMIFIPKGTTYSFRSDFPGNNRYAAINFLGEVPFDRPVIFSPERYGDFSHVYSQLGKFQVVETSADKYGMLALFYRLLAQISKNERSEYKTNASFQKIEPALTYLKENLFDPELRISQLYDRCDMSDTYFRKLFFARFGTSPKKYILEKRLRHAKTALDHGQCGSVAEAASLAGFEDPLYFSKVFKQTFGYPPSQTFRNTTRPE